VCYRHLPSSGLINLCSVCPSAISWGKGTPFRLELSLHLWDWPACSGLVSSSNCSCHTSQVSMPLVPSSWCLSNDIGCPNRRCWMLHCYRFAGSIGRTNCKLWVLPIAIQFFW
jgi:hypothetical protein